MSQSKPLLCLTYHPVVAQLAQPLKVIFVTHAFLHQRGQNVAGVDVKHHQGSQGHPDLFGQFPPNQSHDVVDLPVVLLQVGLQGLDRGSRKNVTKTDSQRKNDSQSFSLMSCCSSIYTLQHRQSLLLIVLRRQNSSISAVLGIS